MSKLLHQLTAGELADRVDAGESFTVVDMRSSESFELWYIEGAVNAPFHPVDGPGGDWNWDRVGDLTREGLVVVICGKGLSSTLSGFGLTEHGYDDVEVVKDGMEGWNKLHEVVELDTGDDDLLATQVQRRVKSCLGYVVGSRSTREAAAVNATRQIHEFELVATDAGMMVVSVPDMHVHAGHVSGGRALADRPDAPYYLGVEATDRDVAHEFTALDDGETLVVGDYDIEVMYAPGHTSDMTNYLVDGRFLLIDDTLLIESVGRTGLQFGDSDAVTEAEFLCETLYDTLLSLSDETRVLPGHVSVGVDGRYGVAAPDELVSASFGDLHEGFDLLLMDVSALVARVTEGTPERPANYKRVVDINIGRASVGDEEEVTELELGPNNCAA